MHFLTMLKFPNYRHIKEVSKWEAEKRHGVIVMFLEEEMDFPMEENRKDKPRCKIRNWNGGRDKKRPFVKETIKPKLVSRISGKSQVLFALVFTTRYLDLFTSFISIYNSVMKVVFLTLAYATVCLIYIPFRESYDKGNDTFRVELLLIPVVGLSFLKNYTFNPLEILWTFSIYLESVAILPQLFMITKTGEAESITTHYLFFLGLYRALYLANWIWRYYMERFQDLISMVSGMVQTIICLGGWPLDLFPVPTFSFDVELKLREGNAEFEKTGRPLKLTRDQKHDILDKLASTIYGFSAYPSGKQIAFVAEALVTKHPCLKEAGSNTGWNGWKNSLLFKMGNYRNKMRRAGCIEVSINAGKRSQNNPDNESPHSGIKRPKRAEVNFLPNFPKGENSTSLECLREQIIEELKKTERNLPLIGRMMQTTFALRRQTIIQFSPPVKEILDLWPALHRV
ncbi:ERD23 protein, partial [Polypterus senegalus]